MANREILEEKSYKTVYREGNTIVKEFTPSHPKANVFNEAYIHACVEGCGVSVPKILGVAPSGGGWALSMEYVEGRTLQNRKRRQNIWRNLLTSSWKSENTGYRSFATRATKWKRRSIH